jgi:hypothetical protein
MNSWFDDSNQEYGIDTHGMKLFSDESFECEIPMDSISKETLAKLIGGVPIIRCKDCKHYYEKEWVVGGGSYTACWYQAIANAQPDDFCSRAERKEHEND